MTTPHPQADLLRAIADGKQMQELIFPASITQETGATAMLIER